MSYQFKVGDTIEMLEYCSACEKGRHYKLGMTSPGGSLAVVGTCFPNTCCTCKEKWKLVEQSSNQTSTQQTEGNKMVYQVVVESVSEATATVPQKKAILFGPDTIEAKSEKEAILLSSANHAKAILDAKCDSYEVSVKGF